MALDVALTEKNIATVMTMGTNLFNAVNANLGQEGAPEDTNPFNTGDQGIGNVGVLGSGVGGGGGGSGANPTPTTTPLPSSPPS